MPRFQIIIETQPLHLLSRIPWSFLSAKLLNWEVNMYTTSYKTCPFKGIDLQNGIVGLIAVPVNLPSCQLFQLAELNEIYWYSIDHRQLY